MRYAKIAILLWVGTAAGACIWLSFFSDARVFRRSISQDDRDAVAVAAFPLPSKKVEVKILHPEESCVQIERAAIESDTFRAYAVRTCRARYSDYWEVHVKQKAPDGTVIDYWFTNQVPSLAVGERAEVKPPSYITWGLNPRTVTVEVYGSTH